MTSYYPILTTYDVVCTYYDVVIIENRLDDLYNALTPNNKTLTYKKNSTVIGLF